MNTDKEIIERVKELAQSYLYEKSIELIDITYRREQGGMVLRLLADTASGISIAECEWLNNYLSEVLDKENVIEDRYLIEVASPGLDRPIVTDRDFERSMGKELDISTYEAIDGKKMHSGKLIGMDKENIVLEDDGVSVVIPRAKIAKAKLKIDFE